MKRNGFTLIEVIAVVTVLGILLTISVPTVTDIINNGYLKGYQININNMVNVAKAYVNSEKIKVEDGSSAIVTINDMITSNLMSPLIDPKSDNECDGYVAVIRNNLNYKYEPFLDCPGGYTSDNYGKTDFTPPTISLVGNSTVNFTVGNVYIDAGATATDNMDGNITNMIVTTGVVNANAEGTYEIIYNVSDSSGNAATPVSRTIRVIDVKGPLISFSMDGNSAWAKTRSITVIANDTSGIKANSLKYLWTTSETPPSEASFSTSFTNGGTINTPAGATGSYYLWVLAKDNAATTNTTMQRTNVFNIDNIAPVITRVGLSYITINAGSSYTDAGATATDAHSGINGSVAATGTVNTVIAGTYVITYSVSDNAGNNAMSVTRTINVVDTTPPAVAFGTNGNATWGKSRSTTVTVSDAAGVNASSLKYQWTTSTTTPTEASFSTGFTSGEAINTPAGVNGTYYLWILAKDVNNNRTITRTNVFNLDNNPPVITMTGSSPITINVGEVYNDAGATATDNLSGLASTVQVTSNVNPGAVGTYTVTYNVTDNAGNAATPITRTVNVVDVTPPAVAFGTNGNVTWGKSRSTTVTVSDAAGVNASSLKYQWNTSTTTPTEASFTTTFTSGGTITSPAGVTGSYYLWIIAKDINNNTTITRTNVFNLDNTPPVIAITGFNPAGIPTNGSYTDAGFTATDNIDGTITGNVQVTNNINAASNGTYYVYYNVSDSSGNTATQITRTVKVIGATSFSHDIWYKTFTAPVTGTYKLEVWGAQGGTASVSGCTGGLGGYSYGEISLTANQDIYVFVGGDGNIGIGAVPAPGGWNGGGISPGNLFYPDRKAGSGGGATDIRVGGTSLSNRVIVAGGGGGSGSRYVNNYGGAGGGLEGGVGATGSGTGGTQTAGGTTGGSLGQGGDGGANNKAGGGGGYYGGGAAQADHAPGGGGSGYIGGVTGDKGTTAGVRSGDGYSTITFISQ